MDAAIAIITSVSFKQRECHIDHGRDDIQAPHTHAMLESVDGR